jgi:hypothetical protein
MIIVMHRMQITRSYSRDPFLSASTIVKLLAHFAIIAFDNGDLSEIWHEIIFQRRSHDIIMRVGRNKKEKALSRAEVAAAHFAPYFAYLNPNASLLFARAFSFGESAKKWRVHVRNCLDFMIIVFNKDTRHQD